MKYFISSKILRELHTKFANSSELFVICLLSLLIYYYFASYLNKINPLFKCH